MELIRTCGPLNGGRGASREPSTQQQLSAQLPRWECRQPSIVIKLCTTRSHSTRPQHSTLNMIQNLNF